MKKLAILCISWSLIFCTSGVMAKERQCTNIDIDELIESKAGTDREERLEKLKDNMSKFFLAKEGHSDYIPVVTNLDTAAELVEFLHTKGFSEVDIYVEGEGWLTEEPWLRYSVLGGFSVIVAAMAIFVGQGGMSGMVESKKTSGSYMRKWSTSGFRGLIAGLWAMGIISYLVFTEVIGPAQDSAIPFSCKLSFR